MNIVYVKYFLHRRKYDIKKENILRVVPVTTLLDRTADDIFLYSSPAVAGAEHNSGS